MNLAAPSPTRDVEAPTTPLTAICPHCEDGTRWVSRRGGNDPDVSPEYCEACDGEGEVTLCCDGCSDPEAVGWFAGFKWCGNCLEEQMADALCAGEGE